MFGQYLNEYRNLGDRFSVIKDETVGGPLWNDIYIAAIEERRRVLFILVDVVRLKWI